MKSKCRTQFLAVGRALRARRGGSRRVGTRPACPPAQAGRLPAALLAVLLSQSLVSSVQANPVHPTVTQGSAVVASQGPNLTVHTSGNAVINWSSFNIAAGETTTFVEPSPTSVVWNNINGSSPSQILGHLDANGYVVLQNPAGFYVGGQAAIRAAGVVMTTAPAVTPDISAGSMWQFNAPPPSARIINYGQISAGPAGPVFLIAHDVENHGAISAPGGNIGLYAGQQVMVSSRPDGRGLSATVTLPQGSVNNSGQLIADAGTIALQAQVVNMGGMIQANSIREINGVIELVAGDDLTLGAIVGDPGQRRRARRQSRRQRDPAIGQQIQRRARFHHQRRRRRARRRGRGGGNFRAGDAGHQLRD